MAKVLENRPLGGGFWLMEAECPSPPRMGQFYMLRAWDRYPVLSRPISVFDAGDHSVRFLYKVVGQGTALLSRLSAGDTLALEGPHGNGWPEAGGRIALVGGGVGIAPLYLAAKTLRAQSAQNKVALFLGFSGQAVLEDAYADVADELTVQVGGLITERVDPADFDHIWACGPEPMMRALYAACAARGVGNRLHVSLETRMACGLGACLVCTCKTSRGNRRACVDGPVFLAEEVFGG